MVFTVSREWNIGANSEGCYECLATPDIIFATSKVLFIRVQYFLHILILFWIIMKIIFPTMFLLF